MKYFVLKYCRFWQIAIFVAVCNSRVRYVYPNPSLRPVNYTLYMYAYYGFRLRRSRYLSPAWIFGLSFVLMICRRHRRRCLSSSNHLHSCRLVPFIAMQYYCSTT